MGLLSALAGGVLESVGGTALRQHQMREGEKLRWKYQKMHLDASHQNALSLVDANKTASLEINEARSADQIELQGLRAKDAEEAARKNRAYQESMYNLQREDAMGDSILNRMQLKEDRVAAIKDREKVRVAEREDADHARELDYEFGVKAMKKQRKLDRKDEENRLRQNEDVLRNMKESAQNAGGGLNEMKLDDYEMHYKNFVVATGMDTVLDSPELSDSNRIALANQIKKRLDATWNYLAGLPEGEIPGVAHWSSIGASMLEEYNEGMTPRDATTLLRDAFYVGYGNDNLNNVPLRLLTIDELRKGIPVVNYTAEAVRKHEESIEKYRKEEGFSADDEQFFKEFIGKYGKANYGRTYKEYLNNISPAFTPLTFPEWIKKQDKMKTNSWRMFKLRRYNPYPQFQFESDPE